MQQLSKFSLRAIGYLVRHFDEPQTVRQIAMKIGISPPSLAKGFKELEESGIVSGKRFGTGILYCLNLQNPVARHLAAASVLSTSIPEELREIAKRAKAVIRKGDELLIVDESHHEYRSEKYKTKKTSPDEFRAGLIKRDNEIIAFIREGELLSGEELFLDAIDKAMIRF